MPTQIMYLIWGLVILLALVLIDIVSRISVALYTQDPEKKFSWAKILDFLKRNIAPYVLVWSVLALIPVGLQYLSEALNYEISLSGIIATDALVGVIWLLIVAKFVQSIFGNFKELSIEVKK